MIEITSHRTTALNEAIRIAAVDLPGPGGAHHVYELTLTPEASTRENSMERSFIRFQKGPILENGVNGISNEALLAVVIHRLDCFQSGAFACKDNEQALAKIKAGLACLHKRTKTRVAQGVEGVNAKHKEA
jgi:hypothetical protein